MAFIPFIREKSCAARIALAALPKELREIADAICKSVGATAELVVPAIIGALSIVTQGKIIVEVTPSYAEELSLYVILVAASGERKSAVISATTSPIMNFQIEHPSETLVTASATSEALIDLMSKNSGRIGIVTDEGSGVIDTILGRYGGKPNFDVWLSGYSGAFIRVDRVTRDSNAVPSAHLAALLAMQPEVAEKLMVNEVARDRGLIARMLFALSPSAVTKRAFLTPPIPAAIAARYNQLLNSFLGFQPSEPARLKFEPDALDALLEIHGKTENAIAENRFVNTEWAKKYVGTIIRFSGLFHLAGGIDRLSHPISADVVASAKEIADYFIQSTEHLSAGQTLSLDCTRAEKVFATIMKFGGSVSESDLSRACRTVGGGYTSIKGLIDLLEEHGYVTRVPRPREGAGRPKADMICATPGALDYVAHCGRDTRN